MNTIERPIFQELRGALADNRAIVITGMRRVGKTTAVKWLMDQIPSSNKVYLDLERLDLRAVFSESNYEVILTYLRNLGLDPAQGMTVALDEIQTVPNLPSAVKYLHDHYQLKFLLTGSSSFYLKNHFTESMAGRKVIYEMFPLGFGEFLDFRGVAHRRRASFEEMRYDPREYERLRSHYEDFITFGGMPDVVLENRPEVKREILNDIFTSYINLDVQALSDFRKLGEMQRLLAALAMRIGNKLDYSKLALIAGISRPTLKDYLEFLEKTYLICQLPAHTSPDRAAALSRKLYFRDNGIAGILANPGDGALFENAIFNQLRTYGDLSYLARGNEYEVDFIVAPSSAPLIGLEAKLHPLEADARKLERIGRKNHFSQTWLVGREPTPGYSDFLWGGLIF